MIPTHFFLKSLLGAKRLSSHLVHRMSIPAFRLFALCAALLVSLHPTAFSQVCTNLCLQQTTCSGGGSTTLSGYVFDPGDNVPVPNAVVYVPNGPVQPFTDGPGSGPQITGSPLVSTTTNVAGYFTLTNMPVGGNIPLVIQAGFWRRQFAVNVSACANNTVSIGPSGFSSHLTLPSTHSEGDIPRIAVVTGSASSVECVLSKMGVSTSEFTDPSGSGRINLYTGDASGGALVDGSTPAESTLWSSQANLNAYDVVLLASQGVVDTDATTADQQVLANFANAGGRVYAETEQYGWLDGNSSFAGTVNWAPGAGAWGNYYSDTTYNTDIDETFSRGLNLTQWINQESVFGGTLGVIPVGVIRNDFTSVIAPTQRWLYAPNNLSGSGPPSNIPLQFTFDTPVGSSPQLGRVWFNDYLVDAEVSPEGYSGMSFPEECPGGPTGVLTAQEKLWEFGLFDLTSSLGPPTATVAVTNSPSTLREGDTADTVTINIADTSATALTSSLTLTAVLPTGVTAASMAGGTGTGWACTSGTLQCTRTASLSDTSNDPIILTVAVASNAPTGSGETFFATISGGGLASNVTGSDAVTIAHPANYCTADANCSAGNWCDETLNTCTPTVPNGAAMPTDPAHSSPTLNGSCSAPGAAALVCTSGVCDTNNKCGYNNGDGVCTSGNAGTVCDSGACSVSGVCEPAGGCEVNGDCSAGHVCSSGSCISSCTPVTSCPAGDNCGTVPNGCGGTLNCGSCNPGQPCSNNVCEQGCYISSQFYPSGTVNPANACQVCVPANSATNWSTAANGATCTGSNLCDQSYSCQAGTCIGSNPVTCSPSDSCHSAGTCNSSTGACSNPPLPDGTACNNGNLCDQTDACLAGVCTGSNPVTCSPSDSCHSAGTCNPSNGICSNPPLYTPACVTLIADGGFEADTPGAAPAEPWTVAANLNSSGFTALTPQTVAGLNLQSGGTALTTVLQSGTGPFTQTDTDLGAPATLRWPRYGDQMASVNEQSVSTLQAENANSLSQAGTVGAGNVDPSDGKIHLRFAFAPILQNAALPEGEQPYYMILVTDLTQNTILYQDFAYAGQSGLPWQSVNTGSSNEIDYTDWQLVDVVGGTPRLQVGDQVQLQIVASGSQPGSQYGKVWVDGAGTTISGISVEASVPALAAKYSNLTYTLTYQNGGASTESNVVVTFVTPPNTTYQSLSSSASCTAPTVGQAGTVSCNLGSLANGASGSLTVTVLASGGSGATTLVARNYGISSDQETALLGPPVSTMLGCSTDSQCSSGDWCDETTANCTPKEPNGTPIPSDPSRTNPILNGTCTPAAGLVVCSSGVCDTSDNKCGYANGDGVCNSGDGGAVCRSGACSVSNVCEPAGGCIVSGDCSSGDFCNASNQCLTILSVTAWPTASAINAGQPLSASTLSGGSATMGGTFGWTTPTIVPAPGTAYQSVTFTPNDLTDYSPVTSTNSVQLTVNGTSSLVVNTAGDDAGTALNCTPNAGATGPGNCSLRDALLQAATLTKSAITFDPTVFPAAGAITLTNGTLDIPANTAITGPATVSGAGAYTVFTVDSGVTGASLAGLAIVNGNSASGLGGGIENNGSLTVNGSTISLSQSAGLGGGIYNNGTLTVSNSTLSGNQAADSGGGIYNQAEATLTLKDTTISGNSASEFGGGIDSEGALTVISSTISGNTATIAGGGIVLGAGGGSLANAIVSGNSADVDPDLVGSYTNSGGNKFGAIGTGLTQLGNYGGPTQTMVPLPGSSAICAGLAANDTVAGITADQRGFANTILYPRYSTPCVDSGAVQTSYALAFTTQPPPSANVGQVLSPAPVVALTESGLLATAATGSVTMADSASLLGGTDAVNLASGSATFSHLTFSAAAGNDVLTATLALAPSLNITAQASTGVTATLVSGALTSPAQGSTLTGQSVTFTWSAGASATAYQLWIGSTGVNSQNVYSSGVVTGTSVTPLYLPLNGETLYARLYTLVNGSWLHADYTFTAAAPAALTAPAQGSTLPGPFTTFTWTAPAGANAYQLWLGTTGVNSQDLYSSGIMHVNTTLRTNMPTNGQTIYARLYTDFNGAWVHSDYMFTSAQLAAPVSPAVGGTLPGPVTTFTWTAATGASANAYQLWIGSTGVGSQNVYSSGVLYSTSVTRTNMPVNGEKLYARLYTDYTGVWVHQDYTLTAAAQAVLTSPSPNSTLPGATVQFTWSAATGSATQYQLWLGTTGVGSQNLYSSGAITATSLTRTNMPTSGARLYARLYTYFGGTWTHADYTYTAAVSAAALNLTSSALTVSAGAQVTFTARLTGTTAGVPPTGTVTFYAGATQLGQGTVVSGAASYATSSLSAGSYTISAVYSGDSNYQSITSNSIGEAVQLSCSSGISGSGLSAFTGTPTANWDFNGDAVYDSGTNTAVLVDGTQLNGQSGTVVYNDPITVDSFTLSFDFNFTAINGRADGLMFLLETNGPTSDGAGDGGIGGLGLNGYGMELDLFDNGPCDGGNGNHAGIDLLSACGTNAGAPSAIATSSDLFNAVGDIGDGTWRTATIQFASGQMSVSITNGSGSSVAIANLQGVALPGFTSGTPYYFGFSAGNGSDGMASRADIRNVSIAFPTARCL